MHNPREVYGLLMRAAAETLLEVAANPKHLGAEVGVLAVLHTWGQNLTLHPHVHCVVTGGGLSPGCGAGNAGIGYEPRNTIRPVFDVWNAIDSSIACAIAA